MWSPDLVIYHHPCADGFGAAWAIHTKWPNAEFVPAKYGKAPPEVTGKNVLIVDFSYSAEVLRSMSRTADCIIILDHHKTAEADLTSFIPKDMTLDQLRRGLDKTLGEGLKLPGVLAHFDMEKSGARLAWEFAHPGEEVPELIRLIEDRDLWRFELEQSRPFATWLRSIPMTFKDWTKAQRRLCDDPHDLMFEARTMQAYHDGFVIRLADSAFITNIAGQLVPCVNCPGEMSSDVGHALLIKHPDAPFSATYYDESPAVRKFSLRSAMNREDVSQIARQFGGGGHRNAAGFTQVSEYLQRQPD